MVYIISKEPIENVALLTQNPPMRDKYNPDLESFCETENGRRFFQLNPLIIDANSNKKNYIENLSWELYWVSVWYNATLYVTIMSDKAYEKLIPLHLNRHYNLGEINHIQELNRTNPEKVDALRVRDCYFGGTYEGISKAVKETFEKLPWRGVVYHSKKLTLEGFSDVV